MPNRRRHPGACRLMRRAHLEDEFGELAADAVSPCPVSRGHRIRLRRLTAMPARGSIV